MENLGKINKYCCASCNHAIVTRNRDSGVTPMFMKCVNGKCKKEMASQFYMVPQDLPFTHEWYAPNDAEKATLKLEVLDHVQKGGLLLRKLSLPCVS